MSPTRISHVVAQPLNEQLGELISVVLISTSYETYEIRQSQWIDGTMNWPPDGPMFILIDWKKFSETVVCCFCLGAYQIVFKELVLVFF